MWGLLIKQLKKSEREMNNSGDEVCHLESGLQRFPAFSLLRRSRLRGFMGKPHHESR
ncbi:hypothetical protein DSLASN_45080 [Desulfoluna limicola]|uniref:Uncharacterized protein n=1 Tax=Desulfoluna limicola TaxID=2810562 RepID=A0ABN6F9I9_9BACT|nr:hypothetical protein DSLASN_45080 [Desulfoluna limicola]